MHATAQRHVPLLLELDAQQAEEPLDTVRITTRFAKATEPGDLDPAPEAETRVRPRPRRPENEADTRVGPAPRSSARRDRTVIDATPWWSAGGQPTPQQASSDELFDGKRTTERAPTARDPEGSALPRARKLALSVSMRVLDGMKLVRHSARLAELSRSFIFVTSSLQPKQGRRVLLRVAYGGGVGTAVGETRSVRSGTGFTVRILASTGEFRNYADRVCSFARGERGNPPRLREPLSIHVL